MGGIKVHGRFGCLDAAGELYMKLRSQDISAELWRCRGGYAVISRAKAVGRNPKVELLERLDAECPECGGPALSVWGSGDAKALKCLRGHGRKRGRVGRPELYHPVFLF